MTVGQLRNTMSLSELQMWGAYVEEYGPLNVPLRVDAAIARAVAPFLKNAKPKDLMPWPREPEPAASPELVFSMLKGISSKRVN